MSTRLGDTNLAIIAFTVTHNKLGHDATINTSGHIAQEL